MYPVTPTALGPRTGLEIAEAIQRGRQAGGEKVDRERLSGLNPPAGTVTVSVLAGRLDRLHGQLEESGDERALAGFRRAVDLIGSRPERAADFIGAVEEMMAEEPAAARQALAVLDRLEERGGGRSGAFMARLTAAQEQGLAGDYAAGMAHLAQLDYGTPNSFDWSLARYDETFAKATAAEATETAGPEDYARELREDVARVRKAELLDEELEEFEEEHDL